MVFNFFELSIVKERSFEPHLFQVEDGRFSRGVLYERRKIVRSLLNQGD